MHRDKFLQQNQLDALISQIYFWNKTLHVSDSSSVHHQVFFTVHTAIVYVIQASRIETKRPDRGVYRTTLSDVYDYVAWVNGRVRGIGGMILKEGSRCSRRETCRVKVYPPQIPHEL